MVERLLRKRYGQPRHFNKRDPLAELVFIMLSTQTREAEGANFIVCLSRQRPATGEIVGRRLLNLLPGEPALEGELFRATA